MTKEKAEEKIEEIKVLTCEMCLKEINPEDYNAYFGACHPCVDKAGRIGS